MHYAVSIFIWFYCFRQSVAVFSCITQRGESRVANHFERKLSGSGIDAEKECHYQSVPCLKLFFSTSLPPALTPNEGSVSDDMIIPIGCGYGSKVKASFANDPFFEVFRIRLYCKGETTV